MRKLFVVMLSVSLFSCTDAINNSVNKQVTQDAIKQYELAVKGGDKTEIYINASMVAEAYKQANDEENYLKWKEITDKHKTEAGL